MFRPLRRAKQQLDENEAKEILARGQTGILAVLGDEGYPYTVPLNYAYEEGTIYFHCARSGHKLDAIRSCEKVSFCVIDRDDVSVEELATNYVSVVAFGEAEILEDEREIFHAAELIGKKVGGGESQVRKEIEKEWNALCCVAIRIEHMTGKEGLGLTRGRSGKAD